MGTRECKLAGAEHIMLLACWCPGAGHRLLARRLRWNGVRPNGAVMCTSTTEPLVVGEGPGEDLSSWRAERERQRMLWQRDAAFDYLHQEIFYIFLPLRFLHQESFFILLL